MREFCCSKFYPEHFSIKAHLQEKQKSWRYIQKTDFWHFSNASPISQMGWRDDTFDLSLLESQGHLPWKYLGEIFPLNMNCCFNLYYIHYCTCFVCKYKRAWTKGSSSTLCSGRSVHAIKKINRTFFIENLVQHLLLNYFFEKKSNLQAKN